MGLPTLQQALLQPLDAIRGIAGMLGMRQIKVTVTRRVWTGEQPGAHGSSFSDYTTTLVNQAPDGSLQPVRVQQASRKDIITYGGRYSDRTLKVGPMTPSYAATFLLPAGGFDDGTVDPQPSPSAVQIIWKAYSPTGTFGLPPGGIICQKVGEEATALHTYVFIEATGRKP